MSSPASELRMKTIFWQWLPLAATWLMMSVEGPFLSAIIARLPAEKLNLAAYGVAFSIALLVESPIIMISSAATELLKDSKTYRRLRNFTNMLNAAITGIMVLLLLPPVSKAFLQGLLELPEEVASLTRQACFLLLPWPAAIGIRRFYQGLLIRNRLTRRVAYSTVIRLIAMIGTALFLYNFANYPGVVVGAAALSAGVCFEAIMVRWMVHSSIKNLLSKESTEEELGYRYIANFYYPLALTSMIGLALHPIITFFMGKSYMPLESLAVLPVLNALVFIFRSVGLSYIEVTIAFMGRGKEWYPLLRKFAVILMSTVGIMLCSIAFSPLADLWLLTVAGLSKELADFARLPLMIQAIIPVLSILLSFQRGILVSARITRPITLATSLEVVLLFCTLFILVQWWGMIGAVAASISMLLGRISANLFLTRPFKQALSENSK